MKVCKKCGNEKDRSSFAPRRDLKDGLATWCKECYAKVAKESYDPEVKQRRERLRHGVTTERYNELLLIQGGACAICKKPSDKLKIDHNHACCPGTYGCSKCVRGLLCHNCNTGIGLLMDDVDNLSNAIQYLNGAVHPLSDTELKG